MPPSVIVGLIAGMLNLARACLRAEAWNSETIHQGLGERWPRVTTNTITLTTREDSGDGGHVLDEDGG